MQSVQLSQFEAEILSYLRTNYKPSGRNRRRTPEDLAQKYKLSLPAINSVLANLAAQGLVIRKPVKMVGGFYDGDWHEILIAPGHAKNVLKLYGKSVLDKALSGDVISTWDWLNRITTRKTAKQLFKAANLCPPLYNRPKKNLSRNQP